MACVWRIRKSCGSRGLKKFIANPFPRIVIGAEILGNTLIENGPIEHAAQSDTIDIAGMHTEADNAPRELIHYNEDAMRPQRDGFTAKEVNAVGLI
jgi:hypothetical protein